MASLSPSTISAPFLSQLPTGALSRGLRQHVDTAWERSKCHFNLIINMCREDAIQVTLDSEVIGPWKAFDKILLPREPESKLQEIMDAWHDFPSWPFIPHGQEWLLCFGKHPSLAWCLTLLGNVHFLKSHSHTAKLPQELI